MPTAHAWPRGQDAFKPLQVLNLSVLEAKINNNKKKGAVEASHKELGNGHRWSWLLRDVSERLDLRSAARQSRDTCWLTKPARGVLQGSWGLGQAPRFV